MFRLLIVVSAAVVLLGACGDSPEEEAAQRMEEAMRAEGMEGVDVEFREDGFSIRTEEGGLEMSGTSVFAEGEDGQSVFEAGGDVEMPEDFPGDVPVLDGAVVTMTMSNPEAHNLTYTTGADVTEAVDYYREAMSDNGWSSEASFQAQNTTMLNFTDEGGRSAVVSISSQQGRTTVNLMVEKPRE